MKTKSLLLLCLAILLIFTGCDAKEPSMYEFTSMDKSDANFYGMTDDEVLYSIQDEHFCMKSITFKWGDGIPARWAYRDYSEVYEKSLYLKLYNYNKETGSTLTLEVIKGFLSEELESDGSLRLFSNGMHPEIKKYINWHRFENAFENNRTEDTLLHRVQIVIEKTARDNSEFKNSLTYYPEGVEYMDASAFFEQFTIKAIDAFIEAYENSTTEFNLSIDELIDKNAVLYK